jgi:hypothetical protein
VNIKTSRARGAAAALTGLALLGGGAAITSSPANAADPVEDCKTAYPVADLAAEDLVTGLTVDTGTLPEGFNGEILGVINDGIAPGLPMVMARLSSDEINRVGIWQGMSGSPVYAEDGRLIGAVAYGLAWGPSTVAGITPFEEMDNYLNAAAPTTVKIGDRLARRIADETEVTARQAAQGFEQLPMPMSFSGVSQRRLNQLQGEDAPKFIQSRGAMAMGAASSAANAAPEDLVAGGNLGAAISYGDITAGGVGTVTSVCEGRLVGFGHPFGYFGRTTLGLMPADAVYVQEDPVGPGFKVANMGLPAGTIDQDRLSGISGLLGEAPEETHVSSYVAYDGRDRDGESFSLVPDFNADVTFSQLLANHDRVIDAWQAGSETASFSIEGTGPDGAFDIDWNDRYVSSFDISFESSYELAETVYLLSRMNGVDVDDVSATADVSDDTATWRLRSVQQRRNGSWVTVDRKHPAVVTPGGTVRLRAHLSNGDDTAVVPLSLAVPNKVSRNGYLEVAGGLSTWDSGIWNADTPTELEAAVASMTKNDEIRASLRFFKRGKDIVREASSQSQSLAVRGRKVAEVRVRR